MTAHFEVEAGLTAVDYAAELEYGRVPIVLISAPPRQNRHAISKSFIYNQKYVFKSITFIKFYVT